MSTAPNQADVLGYDMKVGQDLEASGRSATGEELAVDAMLHRLQCDWLYQTGAPPDERPEFGEDVRRWIGEAVSQTSLEAKAPRLEEVLRRDPRIANVSLTFSIATGDDASQYGFFIRIHAVLVTGVTIDRIVGVSSVTVEFLAQGR